MGQVMITRRGGAGGSSEMEESLKYATSIYYRGSGMPRDFTALFPESITSLSYALYNSEPEGGTAGSSLTIKPKGTITNMSYCISCDISGKNSYETVILDFDTSNVTSFDHFGTHNQHIHNLIGVLDFRSATTINAAFDNMNYVREIRFAPNTLQKNYFALDSCGSLTDDSLVSAANCLNETVTGGRILIHTQKKSRLTAVMGTVSMDESNTYHVFTKDSAGTTTLSDFITRIKGWTVA